MLLHSLNDYVMMKAEMIINIKGYDKMKRIIRILLTLFMVTSTLSAVPFSAYA